MLIIKTNEKIMSKCTKNFILFISIFIIKLLDYYICVERPDQVLIINCFGMMQKQD